MDMSDYKTPTTKGFRYNFISIDNFSIYTWCMPVKNNYGQTTRDEFQKI